MFHNITHIYAVTTRSYCFFYNCANFIFRKLFW